MPATAKPRPRTRPAHDVAISKLAARQHGVVHIHQLLAIGLTEAGVRRRVRAGRLHRIHPGVYAVGHPGVTLEGRLLAATLACGPGAVVSHRSAAHLWELRESSRAAIDLTTADRGHRPIAGVDLHKTRRLTASEVTSVAGIPVTSVARTLADLGPALRVGALSTTIERADALQLLDVRALRASMRRRPGAAAIAAILDGWAPAPTRRELERRLLTLILSTDLPRPRVNAPLLGFEVDLLWAAEYVVVEADGHEFHASRAAIERDRRRDAVLARGGYRVLRFTWQQVTTRPDEVVGALRVVLG